MWIYFWALFSIPLIYVSMCQDHTILITVASQYGLKSKNVIPPGFFFFLKHVLGFLSQYVFPYKSQNYCEKPHFILIGIVLNLQMIWDSVVILAVLSLLIHEHRISFYLYGSSLFSFSSVLQFSVCKSFVSIKFILKYFILWIQS